MTFFSRSLLYPKHILSQPEYFEQDRSLNACLFFFTIIEPSVQATALSPRFVEHCLD